MSIPINFQFFFFVFFTSKLFLNHSFCIRQKVFIVPIVIFFFSFSFTFQCEMNAKDIFLLFGDVIWSENRHFSSDRKTTTTSTNWGQFPFNSFGIFSSKTWHLTNLLFCCCKKPYLVFSWESCFFVQYFKQNRSNHNFTILFLMAQYFLMNKNNQKDGIQINKISIELFSRQYHHMARLLASWNEWKSFCQFLLCTLFWFNFEISFYCLDREIKYCSRKNHTGVVVMPFSNQLTSVGKSDKYATLKNHFRFKI